jgi:DNA-binding protein HU-beta
MTKAELVSKIADESDVTKKAADAFLKGLIETLQQTLKEGGELRLGGLGTFKVMDRKARAGVNPRTGVKLEIPASKAPAFRAAQALKDVVKGPEKKADVKPEKKSQKKAETKKK